MRVIKFPLENCTYEKPNDDVFVAALLLFIQINIYKFFKTNASEYGPSLDRETL